MIALDTVALVLALAAAPSAPAPSLDAAVEAPLAPALHEPTLSAGDVEGGVHVGLLGGRTRVVDELRWAPLDWLELRTALTPLPTTLMARARIGSVRDWGALVIDGGLANVALRPVLGPTVGVDWAAFVEGGLTYVLASSASSTVSLTSRYRHRFALTPAPEHLLGVAARASYAVLPFVTVGAGLAYANALDTKAVEDVVLFAESAQPGITWFMSKGDRHTVSAPLTATFSRTETFDFDVFVTPAVWPKLTATAGAGIRVRL